MKIKSLSFIMFAAMAAASIQSCSPDRAKAYNNRTNVNADGLAFIRNAHEGGLIEIEASKIAQKNSTNKEVTDFAAMMIKDHREAGAVIDTLADHKYVYVRPYVNHDDKALLDSLAKKTGPEFDKEYMELMVKGHEDAEELFKDGTESNYTNIRDVAKQILPTVKEHLEKAKAIQASLK